eukprot:6326761-Prorocentrum_lima.AAC.1
MVCGQALQDTRFGGKVRCEKWQGKKGSGLANVGGGCMVVAVACVGQGGWVGDTHRTSFTQMMTTTGLRARLS